MVEGIYINTGEMAPLRSLYELKERYRFRLILDESVSLGVLGPTGRGAWEEAGLSVGDVDIIAASMGELAWACGAMVATIWVVAAGATGYCSSVGLGGVHVRPGVGCCNVCTSWAATVQHNNTVTHQHATRTTPCAGHALASVGGFCSGSVEVTEHQRLSGLGYCFSAALPPYLATAAIGATTAMALLCMLVNMGGATHHACAAATWLK